MKPDPHGNALSRMNLVRCLFVTALCAALFGCSTESHLVLSDGIAVIATATTTETVSSAHHRGVSYRAQTFQLDGIGELSFDGSTCVLVVDRPRFGAFRFYSPKCTMTVEADEICIKHVALHDDLAVLEKLPTTLQLAGCARRLSPPVLVAEEPSKPPAPREICEPIWPFGDQRRVTSVVVVSSSKALDVKQQPSGDWVVCYWGLPLEDYDLQIEYVFEDGGSGSILIGGRTVID